MTWVSIPNTSLESGKPARSIDVVALRDNPIAIANGDTGAPEVKLVAVEKAPDAGVIGSYAFCIRVSGTDSTGTTVAGSLLRYSAVSGSSGAPSGTWRLMGYTGAAGLNSRVTSLWLRIA